MDIFAHLKIYKTSNFGYRKVQKKGVHSFLSIDERVIGLIISYDGPSEPWINRLLLKRRELSS